MAGNPTTEQIDERILRLLGLENEYELSYEEYVRNLKEAMVASRMSKSKFSTEESESFTNEWKRVRSKKGRFKPKKKKITAEGLGIGKGFTNPLKITQQKFLPPQTSKDTTSLVSSLLKPVDKDVKNDGDNVFLRISKTLDSILQTLIDANKESKKKLEKERIDAEGRARSEKEKALESRPFEKIKKAFDIITKPFQSIWDIFANFIKNVILGRIVVKLLDWFGDPKNKGKVKSLTRFLVDFGPALLAAFILFGTRFGGAVRFLSAIAIKGILRLSKFAIPKILRFITRNPIAAGIALVTAGATVPAMFPGTVNAQERKTDKAPGTKEDKIKALEKQKANLNVFEKIQGKGGEIDEQLSYLKTGKTKSYGFAGGGGVNFKGMMRGAFSGGLGKFNKRKMFGELGDNPIPTPPKSKKQKQKPNVFVSDDEGLVKGKKGVDKVPAMLSDGEIVFSVPAVNYWGAGRLLAMNKEGGGTNKPKMISGIPHAAGGGRMGYKENEKESNIPFYKDPFEYVNKFIKYKFGADLSKQNTWGDKKESVFPSIEDRGKSIGSLLTDPFGAISRISGRGIPSGGSGSSGGLRIPGITVPSSGSNGSNGSNGSSGSLLTDPFGAISRISGRGIPSGGSGSSSGSGGSGGLRIPGITVPSSGSNGSNGSNGSLLTDPFGAISRISGRGIPSGGSGGSGGLRIPGITVPSGSLSLGSQKLPKEKEKGFFENIKSATYRDAGSLYAKQMLGGLGGPINESDLSKESREELQKAIQRAKKRTGSEISKAEAKIKELESSGASKTPKGREALATQRSFLKKLKSGGIRVQYTDYADEKAKSILGQFWATERSKKEGGGYNIEDKYDFEQFKDKKGKVIDPKDILFGKGKTIQERAQAAFLMNPLAAKQDVDMVLAGKRSTGDKMRLAASKVPLIGGLFKQQKPETEKEKKNKQALESKRPWWDKMGMFGGASAQMKKEKMNPQSVGKQGPPTISRKTTPPPIKPPTQPGVRFVNLNQGGARNKSQLVGGGAPKAPSFSPNHGRTNTAAKTLGVNRK